MSLILVPALHIYLSKQILFFFFCISVEIPTFLPLNQARGSTGTAHNVKPFLRQLKEWTDVCNFMLSHMTRTVSSSFHATYPHIFIFLELSLCKKYLLSTVLGIFLPSSFKVFFPFSSSTFCIFLFLLVYFLLFTCYCFLCLWSVLQLSNPCTQPLWQISRLFLSQIPCDSVWK